MKTLQELQQKNPDIIIHPVEDDAFRRYGRRWTEISLPGLTELAGKILSVRQAGVAYEASIPALEALADEEESIRSSVFGGMPIQIGYCSGMNLRMGAMEFHQGSEFMVTLTELVVLLATYDKLREISGEFTIDTNTVEAFFLPRGEMIEIYGGVMHYAPIQTEAEGFLTLIILPRDTNTALSPKPQSAPSDKLLFARNKWLISHPEAGYGYMGITGPNITLAIV